jgi:PAS domain S-box-containing protein
MNLKKQQESTFNRLSSIEQELDFRLVLEAAPDAMIIVGPDGKILVTNKKTEELFGYSKNELLGKPIEILMPERYRTDHVQFHRSFRKETRPRKMGSGLELCGLRKDGLEFPVEVGLSPHEASKGLLIIAVMRDVSEAHLAQDHQRMLLAELDHRVKNTLSLVLSIAQQTLRKSTSLRDFQESFVGRITALSRVHQLLTEKEWKPVRLRNIFDYATKPFDSSAGKRLSFEGDDTLIVPKMAQSLYLVVHELITNATKYGAFANEEGRIDIRWSRIERNAEEVLYFTWVESGGPAHAQIDNQGFGTRLIERVINYELRGKLIFEVQDTGLTVECFIPLSVLVSSKQQEIFTKE